MASISIIPLCAFSDNYIWIIKDEISKTAAVVDPGDAHPVQEWLNHHAYRLTQIWITHHHSDHQGGAALLKAATGARVFGPKNEQEKIPSIDEALSESDEFIFADHAITVFDIPGHTKGHIAFYAATLQAVFCGDTLFSAGCGRLFEGSPAQMWHSLKKIRALPLSTKIFCGHEYTLKNLQFALTLMPAYPPLHERLETVLQLRAQSICTLPSTLAQEVELNPFLRADDPIFMQQFLAISSVPEEIFAHIRTLKDKF